MTTTRIDTTTAHDVLARMITAANGGTMPDRLDLHVSHGDAQTALVYDPADGRTKLIVAIGADGQLTVSVGVATWWTTLFHDGFRFARTPGGQLVLLGRDCGRAMHFWIDDDRLWSDAGSPMCSHAQDREAIAAFDAEFAALGGEAA